MATFAASSDASTQRAGRAAPLSAPERRAAIIDATIPLLRASGTGVTTKMIADAAEIAEGTIFRVFPDKASLIAAAVEAALAPDATIDQLRRLGPDLPFEDRLAEAVSTLQAHFLDIWSLMMAVGPSGAPRLKPAPAQAFLHFGPVLRSILDPHEAKLRVAPTDAARILLALVLGACHPAVVEEPFDPQEIVALFLGGIRKKPR